jgi:hypothetical protein
MAPIVEVQIAALTLDSLGIGTLYPRGSLSSRFLLGWWLGFWEWAAAGWVWATGEFGC